MLVNLNPSLKAAGVRSAYSSLQARLIHPCCKPLRPAVTWKSCAALRSRCPTTCSTALPATELSYALRRAGVSTLVLAPELRGTSFVDVLGSIL